jgi:phosphocarrier protein HPr
MPDRRVTVVTPIGLHARPALIFTQTAAASPVQVRIGRPGGEPVDAASILSVLGLDVRGGEDVVLGADGEGADEALDTLAALLSRNLDRPG